MGNLRRIITSALAVLIAQTPLLTAQHDPASNTRASLSDPQTVSIEHISTEPVTNLPATTLRWSPDGSQVAWMHSVPPEKGSAYHTSRRELWSQSITGTPGSSQPTLLVTPLQVSNALRGTDAPIPLHFGDDDEQAVDPYLLQDFLWSPDHQSLLLISATAFSWLDLRTRAAHVIVNGDEPIADVSLAPNGRTISFIRDHSLWLVDAQGGTARVLAKSADPHILEGEPDWPYRHDLHLKHAYQWSPDSTRIAYLETDDRKVAQYTLRASDGTTRSIVFPKPGEPLPVMRVLVRSLTGTKAQEIKLGVSKDSYLPRLTWLPDSRHLAIERLDRRQQTLELLVADAQTGSAQPILVEKDRYWVNLSDDLHFLKDGSGFLWSSERSGFRHLYRYDMKGNAQAQLTNGDWEVTTLNAVDEARGLVYFTATRESALERHLYEVHLDGTGLRQITHRPGTHDVDLAPDAQSFADTFSDIKTRPETAVFDMQHGDSEAPEYAATGPPLQTVSKPAILTHKDEPPLPVEFMTIKSHQDVTLNAFMIKPKGFDATHKYPVIMYMAGGPGEQLVRNMWGGPAMLWMQLMAHKGYLIFVVDNQGTAGRGHYFEEPIHLRFGAQEMIDQRDGVNYLKALPYVDGARIGACGSGYGGFLAVHAMLDRPIYFSVAFAGSPVVDWHYYDAVFAERYLDDPVVHADGWDASVALDNRNIALFKGKLLVAQGTEDEVVHLENTLTLQDHLVDAGKSIDLLLLPDRGNMLDDLPARTLLFTRMTEFFLNNL